MSQSFETNISEPRVFPWRDKFAQFLKDFAPVGPATARRYVYVLRELLGKGSTFSYTEASRFIKRKNRLYVRAAIVKFLEFLGDADKIEDDVLAGLIMKLPKPREAPPEARVIPTIEEIKLVLQHMEKEDRRIALFMFYTGVRVHEALGVKLRDIDFSTGRVIIYGKGRIEKKSRPAKIPMGFAAELQREAKDLGLLEAELIFWPNSKASPEGRRVMLNRKLKQACIDAVGKPFGGSHNFRRVVATKLLEETGRDLQLVQRTLGHEKIDTTLKYTQYMDREKDLDRARDIMGEIGAPEGRVPAKSKR